MISSMYHVTYDRIATLLTYLESTGSRVTISRGGTACNYIKQDIYLHGQQTRVPRVPVASPPSPHGVAGAACTEHGSSRRPAQLRRTERRCSAYRTASEVDREERDGLKLSTEVLPGILEYSLPLGYKPT